MKEEVEVFSRQFSCLNATEGVEGDFFAVDGGGGEEVVLDCFIGFFATISHCDAVDGRSKVGMDSLFVSGSVCGELFLGFLNDGFVACKTSGKDELSA